MYQIINNSKKFFVLIFFVFLFANFSTTSAGDSTFVGRHGLITTLGNKLVDKNGNVIVLRGMSLFWSQWMPQYYNQNCVKWLRDDWKCTVVRAAMGVEQGGYLANPPVEKAKIKAVINACIDNGIYVIVDWHDHNAQNHLQQSISFFEEIANEYGHQPNLIYEIFNEPLQVSWNSVVKPYADSVVKHIRAIDPDNLIIVGTPTWSQNVDEAANNQLTYNNIAYALHFYAATHKQPIRNRAINALNKGAALFVSEFGTSEASGTGILDSVETEVWIKFMEDRKLSWCNWSITDKVETSAALKPGASGNGGWSLSNLSKSGLMIRDKIISANDTLFTSVPDLDNLPSAFELYQNYPNPFNPSTNITYSILSPSNVKLVVYNILGKEVATLVNETKQTGIHTYNFDGTGLSSGVYICKLITNYNSSAIKMILLR